MPDNLFEGVNRHPLVAAQEKRNESTVEFRGFLGTEDEQFIRLYTDLEMSSCVEIPKDAILHWEIDPDGAVGQIRVFVSASREVTERHQSHVVARSSALSLNGASVTIDESGLNLPRPLPPLIDFYTCAGRCEGAFASMALRAAELEARALRELNPVRKAQLFALAEDTKSRAKDALHKCLSQCSRIAPPLFRAIPNPDGSITLQRISLGEFEQEICVRHLGEISCAE